MRIHIQHGGQETGPFSPDQVRAGLASGTYQPTDLAWYEGASGWLPLSTVPGITGDGPPPMPGAAPAKPAGSGLGIASLVCGVLSFLTLGLTAIPAIICGHIARKKIKENAGLQTSGGLALAGLILGYIGLGILGIAFIAGLTAPLVIRMQKKGHQAEARNNVRALALALSEFESEYGSFPNEATAKAVAETTMTEPITGNSANDRFRQLIQSGIMKSEVPLYAKAQGVRKPDDVFTGNEALRSGECGFAYIEFTGPTHPRPMVIGPCIPGSGKLDIKSLDYKAVVLWSDSSVKLMPIDRATGQVMGNGRNLLDPGHPVWQGGVPVIAWPK